MKKLCFFVLSLFFSLTSVVGVTSYTCFAHDIKEDTNFNQFFSGLFGESVFRKANKNEYVDVSGSALGFSLQGDGVVVVAIGDVEAETGKVCPCDGQDIQPGDLLVSINENRLESANDIEEIINSFDDDESFELAFLRNKRKFIKHIVPAIEEKSGKKRLGLWIRDSLAGIGTLTFVTEKNRFGALGHTVCDIDTGTTMPVSFGKMFPCGIVGIVKGQKGAAGELKGVFVQGGAEIGNVFKNNEFGLYGEFFDNKSNFVSLQRMKVATQNEIHPGKAQILSTISGTQPKAYDIEIIKTNTQGAQKSKSMIIRVTDTALISKTGGIVQGMSGSPIIQDGKFVGAVTHVFLSDPTKGYGIYAEWMLEQ